VPVDGECFDCEEFAGPLGRRSFGLFQPPGQRYVGWGEPLVGGSWLNRPLSAGWLVGALAGDTIIQDQVDQETDLIGGYRFGWDFAHYWGCETRIAFARNEVTALPGGNGLGSEDVFFWDTFLLYYPWGDSRLRPFATLGLGLHHFDFNDAAGASRSADLFAMPLGVGIKYRVKPWWVMRMDFLDNIAFSDTQFDTMHNFTFTLGTELRFGGRQRVYWPWDPLAANW
jgi:hypothetical protein